MFEKRYSFDERDPAMLAHPVQGIVTAQRDWEFFELIQIYCLTMPHSVVEIGTWHGGSLYYWLKYAQRDAHIISVDTGPASWGPPEPDFDTSKWFDWVPEGVYLHKITGNSRAQDVQAQVGYLCPEGIDWLFIDGDHSYEGAKFDFETYGPKVNEGGVICFHDLITPAGQPHIQVGRLWEEIREAGYVTRELYSERNQQTMGIGVIYV